MPPSIRCLALAACTALFGVACGEQAPRTVAQELAPRLEPEPDMPAGDGDLPGHDALEPFEIHLADGVVEEHSVLERIPLSQLRLAGLVLSPSPTALVEDERGRGHLVRVGTSIGTSGGRVTAIDERGLVIDERYVDDDGLVEQRTVRLRLDLLAG